MYLDLYKEELQLEGRRDNTIKNIDYSIKTFKEYLETKNKILTDNTIKEVTITDAFNYRKYLLKQDYKCSSINTKINCIKGYFTFLSKHKIIKENPFSGFENIEEVDKTIKDILTKEEIIKLINSFDIKLEGERNFDYISKRNKALISILASTGIRIENLLSITVDRLINIPEGYKIEYTAKETKGKVSITIYIVGKNKELLNNWLKVRRDKTGLNLLFNSFNGKKISRSDMLNIINKRISYLNIKKHIVSHSFRSFCANNMLLNNVSPEDVKKMLGWKISNDNVMYNVYLRDSMQESKYIEYSKLLWKE